MDERSILGMINEVSSDQSTTQASGQQAQPGAQGPLRVNVSGQEYVFNSPEELSAALSQTIEAYNRRIADLQAAAQSQKDQATTEKGSYATGDEPRFSQERYIELLRKDPIEAQEYLDSFRFFGGRVERPSELITAALSRIAAQDRVLAAYQFRDAHPEFPGGEHATEVLEQVRAENNLPFTLAGLEAALGIAQSRGLLPTAQQYQAYLQAQYQASQAPQGAQQAPRPKGPPALGRSSAEVSPDFAQMAESLTPEQIEKIFERLGQIGR